MAWDPITYKGGRTKLVSTTGEGNDWIKLMALRQPRKEDVIRSLLKSMKQAVENTGPGRQKKPRALPPLELETLEAGKMLTLEIRVDCKTIVDWINSQAKLKRRRSTVANTQNLLRKWWGGGVNTAL